MQLDELVHIACLMEASAKKPGNVHPGASFADLCYDDFVKAARAIAEPLSKARDVGLGFAILNSVQAVQAATGSNVNLGIILLLAPLAMVPNDEPLGLGIVEVLARTTVQDAELVYEAIRLSSPGGMGEVSSQDIRDQPTITLRQAMSLAANRDRIAEQYVTNFSAVFISRQKLVELMRQADNWEAAVVRLHLWIMSRWPDTLIARKCGFPLAEQSAHQAAQVLEAWNANPSDYEAQLRQFDRWLRADGHRRNPGTTADIVAATLFAALRDGLIKAPSLEEIRTSASSVDPHHD